MDMYEARRIDRWDAIRRVRTPLVAAVSGFCLGGGNELPLACDLIVASETAQFGQPETGLGIIPGAGGTQRLTRAIGKAKAMDVILSGRFLDAWEAERTKDSWLASTAKEAWLGGGEAVARVIAERAIAQRLAKESVNRAYESTLETGLDYERKALYLAFASEDARGLIALTEAQAGSSRPVARSPRAWRPRRAGTNRPACGRSKSTTGTSGTQPGSSSSSTSSSSSRSRSSPTARRGSEPPRLPRLRRALRRRLVGLGRLHVLRRPLRHGRPRTVPMIAWPGRGGRARLGLRRGPRRNTSFALLCGVRAVVVSWTRTGRHRRRETASERLHPRLLAAVALFLVSAAVEPPYRYWLWAVALAIDLGTPLASQERIRKVPIHGSAPGARGPLHDHRLRRERAGRGRGTTTVSWGFESGAAAALGFAIAGALWWIYFDYVDSSIVKRTITAEADLPVRASAAAHRARRARRGIKLAIKATETRV